MMAESFGLPMTKLQSGYKRLTRQEKQQQSDVLLSERMVSLGIMGDQLRVTLKPLGQSQQYRVEGFKR